MQDFRSISELSGRIFAGGAIDWTAGGDNRSLKSFPSAIAPPPQLKCPRCESLNTKFCYYNNYNLSQPRHFCKSCRRYWTRGGVLRNVPVGGGCRKPKRSSSSKSSSEDDKDRRHKHSGSRSSSDSSTLTLTLTPDCPAPLPDSAISFKSSPPNPNPPNSSNPIFLDPPIYPPAEIFPDLTPDQSILKFNFLDPLIYRHPDRRHRNPDEIRGQEFIYQNAPGEPPPATAAPPPATATARDAGGEIDWPSGLDSGIYDLAGAGDPAAYWNPSHWSDGDPSLYLP